MPAGSAGSASVSARPVPWIGCRWRWPTCSSAIQPGQAAIEFALAGGRLQVVRRQRAHRAGRRRQRAQSRRPAGRAVDERHRARRPDDRAGGRPHRHLLLSGRGGRLRHCAHAGLTVAAPPHRHRRAWKAARCAPATACRWRCRALRSRACPPRPPQAQAGPIRVVLGPQDDHFTPAGIATLVNSEYAVSEQADRMGMRLMGPRSSTAPRASTSSPTALPRAAIQVPGNGQPLILLADRQTTGGYPKIATVISWDLPRLVQSPSRHQAALCGGRARGGRAHRRAADAEFRALIAKVRPAGLAGLDSSELLSVNLVDGVVDARASRGPFSAGPARDPRSG